mmetsp:Transcript_52055/g.122177  ORF Transcript_52055/g.122177 Transcript_52055/m.122177 type:complete len:254 (-) Transcript_52055:407-1168(-)
MRDLHHPVEPGEAGIQCGHQEEGHRENCYEQRREVGGLRFLDLLGLGVLASTSEGRRGRIAELGSWHGACGASDRQPHTIQSGLPRVLPEVEAHDQLASNFCPRDRVLDGGDRLSLEALTRTGRIVSGPVRVEPTRGSNQQGSTHPHEHGRIPSSLAIDFLVQLEFRLDEVTLALDIKAASVHAAVAKGHDYKGGRSDNEDHHEKKPQEGHQCHLQVNAKGVRSLHLEQVNTPALRENKDGLVVLRTEDGEEP